MEGKKRPHARVTRSNGPAKAGGLPPKAPLEVAPAETVAEEAAVIVPTAAVVARAPARASTTPAFRTTATGDIARTATGDLSAPRTPNDENGAILITGICGRLGRVLARLLHRDGRVIGIDRRAFAGKPKDIVHHQFDLRRKKTRDVFRAGGIRAVVHLGIMHDLRASTREHHTWNVVGFQKLLEYVAAFRVPKLVVLSSANVYGPSAENPQFLTEEAPLLGSQHFSEIRDLVEVDILAQSFFWKHPEVETVILRPCHILGTVKNAPSNYLRFERPLALMGFDPMVQVIHERDVARALTLSLAPGVRGIFNLKGPGEVALSRVFRVLGKHPIRVPSSLAAGVLSRMWRYRLTSFPTPELDHIRYVCMVDDTRARETLGFRPVFDLEETVRAVMG